MRTDRYRALLETIQKAMWTRFHQVNWGSLGHSTNYYKGHGPVACYACAEIIEVAVDAAQEHIDHGDAW